MFYPLSEQGNCVARAAQGCTIVWNEYTAMAHCFPFAFYISQTEHDLSACARFCVACVNEPSSLRTEGTVVGTSMEDYITEVSKIRGLIDVTMEEIKQRTHEKSKSMIAEFTHVKGRHMRY